MPQFNSYQPLEDRVLIKPIKKTESEKTESGLIVDMKKKEVAEGEVIAVGQGRYATETGQFMPTVLAKGDVVLYGIHQGMEIQVPNENGGKDECRVMREADVLFLISRKPTTDFAFTTNGSAVI